MQYAEVNWIVLIIFAIGIISQIVEAMRKNKPEEIPPREEDYPSNTPSSAGQNEREIDDLLQSLGLPPREPENVPPPIPTYTPSPEPVRQTSYSKPPQEDSFQEGPSYEFPKQSREEMYGSPFLQGDQVLPARAGIPRIDFDEDLLSVPHVELSPTQEQFQVIGGHLNYKVLRQRLQTPQSLREVYILKEILDPPKGLAF